MLRLIALGLLICGPLVALTDRADSVQSEVLAIILRDDEIRNHLLLWDIQRDLHIEISLGTVADFYSPLWWPEQNELIAVYRTPDENGLMHYKPGNPIRLTTLADSVTVPYLSQQPLTTASALVILRFSASPNQTIRVDLRTGEQQIIFENDSINQPQQSPDSDRILYENDAELVFAELDGTPLDVLDTGHTAEQGTWSPDGEWIAYSGGASFRPEVYIIRPDGTDQTNISDHSLIDRLPVWSSDSARLAYVSNRDGAWHIYAYNLADGETQKVSDLSVEINNLLAWKLDGRSILFVSENRRLYLAEVDGDGLRELTLPVGYTISESFTRFDFRP